MLQIQQFSLIIIFLMFFSLLSASVNEMKQNRKTCTKVISWELKNTSVKFNTSSVLKKGDGGKQIVHHEIVKEGVINVTTSLLVCCPGYKETPTGNCRRCRRGRYGENCSQMCQCNKKRKCDRVTGACTRCKHPPCDDETIYKTDSASPITTASPSTVQVSTQRSTKDTTTDPASSVNNRTDSTQQLNSCDICIAANNCTEEQNCKALAAGRADTLNDDEDKDTTILIAVILSLGTFTILLLVGIVFRERYHKSRKRRQRDRDIVKFTSDAEYVDPEPIYFEIRDDDVLCNGNACQNGNNSNTPRASNEYHMCEKVNRSDSTDTGKDNVDEDECGYLNPYTPLRFARSETNLYRDKKVLKQGEYDVINSNDKSVPKENTTDKEVENSDIIADDDNELDRSSQSQKLLTGQPVYFVLEKVQKEAESKDFERDKLLSRSSRSSI